MNNNRFFWKPGDFTIEDCDSDRYIAKAQPQKTEDNEKIGPSTHSAKKLDSALAGDSKHWWKKLWL